MLAGYGLTEREQLFDRVSHERLLAIRDDENNIIHDVILSTIYPKTLECRLTREEAQDILDARQQEIAPYLGKEQQSGYCLNILPLFEHCATPA